MILPAMILSFQMDQFDVPDSQVYPGHALQRGDGKESLKVRPIVFCIGKRGHSQTCFFIQQIHFVMPELSIP